MIDRVRVTIPYDSCLNVRGKLAQWLPRSNSPQLPHPYLLLPVDSPSTATAFVAAGRLTFQFEGVVVSIMIDCFW